MMAGSIAVSDVLKADRCQEIEPRGFPRSGLRQNIQRSRHRVAGSRPWRISNTLEADFCVGALNEALHRFGRPEIMNSDQGSQFTHDLAWREDRAGNGITFVDSISPNWPRRSYLSSQLQLGQARRDRPKAAIR